MHFTQLLTNIIIMIFAAFGIVLQKKNILIIVMCIELLLLSNNLNFIIASVYLDDMIGQMFGLFILTLAASEGSLGLSILILYFKLRGNVNIDIKNMLRY